MKSGTEMYLEMKYVYGDSAAKSPETTIGAKHHSILWYLIHFPRNQRKIFNVSTTLFKKTVSGDPQPSGFLDHT